MSADSTFQALRPRAMRLAFYGRTALFDPQASPVVIRRQLDSCAQAAERLGGEITGHYWDIRSGKTSPETASDPPPIELGVVRAGGIADLLCDSASGLIDAVLVERIDRVSRVLAHTTNVEQALARHGVGLFAADHGPSHLTIDQQVALCAEAAVSLANHAHRPRRGYPATPAPKTER